jgi:hypothetical protein
MFVWILILGSWGSLLLLIMHDATTDEAGNRSAVSRAARNFIAAVKDLLGRVSLLVDRSVRKAQTPKTAPGTISSNYLSKPPVEGIATIEHIASAAPLAPQVTPAVAEQAQAVRHPTRRWWRTDDRIAIAVSELELMITETVRKADPCCEALIGVIVQQTTPKSRSEPNWRLRGVRFGKADRNVANKILANVVKRMQQEFRVADANRTKGPPSHRQQPTASLADRPPAHS